MPTNQIKAYLGEIPLFTEEPDAYSRPVDWLELPVLVSGTDHRVVGLFAVGNHLSNFVALQFSGDYTVDWGDGTAPENFSAATIAYHNYVYSNLSADTEFELSGSGETHRQAIISITPQSGQNLTSLNFNLRHNQSGLSAYKTPFLDISVCAPSCSSITFGGTNGNLHLLEQVSLIQTGTITNGTAMFQNCSALQSVPLFDLSAMTNGSNMFANCFSLRSVPLFNLSAMTNGIAMFSGCNSLQSVPLFNLSAMTNGTGMFQVCRSLLSVPLFNLSAMTNGSFMFRFSYLKTVPLFNLSAMTNGSFMFADMPILQSIPNFNLSAMTNGSNMFENSNSLQFVPSLNLSAMTNGASMFNNCSSLSQCKATGIAETISFANCRMSATELNQLYTNLSTVTSKTITVSGNWGYSSSNTSIATDKGWTVN